FGLLGPGVACGGALDAAIGDFKSGFFVVDADGDRNFQQDVLFVPVGGHFDVDARGAGGERDVADEGGVLEMIFYAENGGQRATFDEFDLVDLGEIPMLLLEVGVNVPGVPLFGLVAESL